jgi:hypothetical protein
MSPKSLKFSIIILFILVFISLGLNWYLISQLLRARQQAIDTVQAFKPVAQNALAEVDRELAAFQESTIAFTVDVKQDFPIQMEIPINEVVQIPISVTLPIKQEFETTISVDPLQTGLEIPVDVVVPVDVEVPIDVTVPIEIDRTIPISTSIPLDLDFPIAIAVSDTDLVAYIERLREGLAGAREYIEQLTIGVEE